jgi:hypothetical protein
MADYLRKGWHAELMTDLTFEEIQEMLKFHEILNDYLSGLPDMKFTEAQKKMMMRNYLIYARGDRND